MKNWVIFFLVLFSYSIVFAEKKVGLVLSGGGALGYAHIGAIQALEENGIRFDCISGTSMGAIIGVLYAAGYHPQEMLKMIKDEKFYKISKLMTLTGSSKNGFASHKTLRKLLQELIPHNSFDSLSIPYYVCLTNLDKGKWESFNSGGSLHDYVIASASIPVVYEVVEINGVQYIDGGVLNNMPAQPLKTKQKCDILVGIDVLPFSDKKKLKKMEDVFLRSVRIMQHQNSKAGRLLCHFLIEPQALIKYHEFDFNKYLEIYQYGYDAVIDYIKKNPKIKQIKKE